MAFDAILETSNDIATITLSGELDASTAAVFKEQVEKAATQKVKRLVLMMQNLGFMASAGLRVLIFAKQKMGADADIYIVGAQEMVMDTLNKTGYDQSVIVLDEYDPAQIEAV
ncbi:MAG TPA: anti-sigma factor antagonist [Leptolyngbyaceae cyanobacterium]